MDLEELKNIDSDSFQKALQIVAILGDGQVCVVNVVTVAQCVKEYKSYVSHNRAKKTLEGVDLIGRYLLEYFAPNRDIKTIQLKDCECFLDALKKNAPKGVYNYLRALKAMWNKLLKWNYVSTNPFIQVELPKRQSVKPAYLTEEMLEKILPYISNEIVRDVVITTFYTGMRRGEVVQITWQDVNLQKEVLTIGSDTFQTKTRKQRVIPIHPKVKALLMKKVKSKKIKVKNNEGDGNELNVVQLPNKKQYVFCKSSGYCFTADYVSRQFKKACRKAGIDEAIHYHSIRHGSITRMIVNGANLPTVQRVAGHANIQTTMMYTHIDMENMRDAVALL
jgi:integrase/recombinase XerC